MKVYNGFMKSGTYKKPNSSGFKMSPFICDAKLQKVI